MAQLRDLGRGFEQLVEQILRADHYDVAREFRTPAGFALDLIARKGQRTWAIDIKLLAKARATLADLRNIAGRSKALLSTFPERPVTLVLVVSSESTPEHRGWVQRQFGLEVWDRKELTRRAAVDRRTADELRAFLEHLAHFEALEPAPQVIRPGGVASENTFGLPNLIPIEPAIDDGPPPDFGASLCAELREVPRGRRSASKYEDVCKRIIDYLFGDFLIDPRQQPRSTDGLNIMDIAYRLRPGHPFWDTLTRDMRARLIIFECKNYGNSVSAMQVYTTERYMHVGAFRPLCFILTREAPSKNARLAAFGAMRESGKLFVFLTDDDLCQMLDIRDAQRRLGEPGNDPAEVLDQKIYDSLSSIPR
jgi:hypothetical protein